MRHRGEIGLICRPQPLAQHSNGGSIKRAVLHVFLALSRRTNNRRTAIRRGAGGTCNYCICFALVVGHHLTILVGAVISFDGSRESDRCSVLRRVAGLLLFVLEDSQHPCFDIF